jgi:linoleoyl-CoA desaturase
MQEILTATNDAPAKPPTRVKFDSPDAFRAALRTRIDAHFTRTGHEPRGGPSMYLKTAVVLACLVTSYVLLVFAPIGVWLALPLTILLGLSLAAAGFNIQHDGGHGAYSNHRWVNKLAASTLDLFGASSYYWARKHNAIHHSYTNVTGHDDDINLGFLGRLSPHQRRFWFHRYQYIYLWFLYGLLPIKWHSYDDFHDLATGRIGQRAVPRPRGRDLLIFVGGKLTFLALALGIPMVLHPWWTVLAVYAAVSFVQGVVLSVVFQLAHCVEEAEFPLPRSDSGRMATGWAEHQVQTTADFAPHNRLLTWFVGGLNFQIEHHLFPHVCHVHYPALAPVVRQTCREFGVRYTAQPSLPSAIASHFRWLRRMGAASGAARAREHAGQTAQAAADHVRSQDTGRHGDCGARRRGQLATSGKGR